jgi:O-antigen ligase
MIQTRPVFGFGPGNYALTYEDFRTRYRAVRRETVHAHNEYLELVAEYGLVGGLLILLALLSLVVQMIRFIKTAERSYQAFPAVALLGALAGTAVHGFFDFELHNFPNAMMLALLAGCAVAPLLQQRREKTARGKDVFTTADARGAPRGSEGRGEQTVRSQLRMFSVSLGGLL